MRAPKLDLIPLTAGDNRESQWFGTSWDAPVNEITQQVPVPVGRGCLLCGLKMTTSDSGVLIVYHGERTGRVAHHLRCWFEWIGVPITDASPASDS